MEICCTSECAMTQHKCSAALFRAKCTQHCSVLLCKTGSQQAVFHCSYTYGDVLFIQVCSDPAQMQCSSVQGKMLSRLFSAALQNSRQCFIAVTLMEICCTSGCALTQHKCNAALFRAKCTPHCSVLLCKTGSQQAVFHCSHTYGDLLYIRVCNDPAQMQCSSVQGKMHSPLFSAAMQNRLTAGSLSLQLHLWRFALYTAVR